MTVVNPVHFKPIWFFARLPDEADDVKQAFGENCLALSDAEMICMRVALSSFAEAMKHSEEERMQRMVSVIGAVSEKLKCVLDIEFEG